MGRVVTQVALRRMRICTVPLSPLSSGMGSCNGRDLSRRIHQLPRQLRRTPAPWHKVAAISHSKRDVS